MRYADLNLRTRQSGKFQGKNKITKKGRRLLRKVVKAIAFPLVRKGYFFGEFYHQKKNVTKMAGHKAMTVVGRNLLKKLFGWCLSGEPFNQQRFFSCKSRYEKLVKAA